MNKQTLIFILFLSFLAVLLGYNYFVRPFDNFTQRFINPQVTENFDLVEDLSPEEKILTQLSNKEKVSQLIALPVNLDKEASSSAWIKNNKPGFITVFGSNISRNQLDAFKAELKTNNFKLKTYLATDHEGGSVQRLTGDGFTKLPSWQDLCQLEDKQERLALLASSSAELSKAGIDIIFAPVIDVGDNNILKSRICSDNPDLIASRSAEFILAFSGNGILPVLKHFPGIGKTSKDLHKEFDRVAVEAEDALLYKNLLDKFNFLAVMVSHTGVKNQYPDIPCSLSKACVGELTNNYPDNIVFSDALEMKSALYNKNSEDLKTLDQVSIEAINAGINILVFGEGVDIKEFDMILNNLLKEYEANKDFAEKVDKSVLKIISAKDGQPLAEKKS